VLVSAVLIFLQGGIQCTTVAHLALILTRARSAPLELEISVPAIDGTLELISSRNCLIRSLTIVGDFHGRSTVSGFQDFNLSQLQELQIAYLEWNKSKQIMDLALRSSCSNMTLNLRRCPLTLDLFKHRLIQQVVDIGIAVC
jgi:hypothetical protein